MSNRLVAGGGIQSESISDFDPRTLGGCVLWLDAADSNTVYSAFTGTFPSATGTTLAAIGDNVVLWSDKSGQTNNATQNTDSSIATFTLNTGIPATMITNGIRFGNLGSFRLDPNKVPIGTSPMTIFIVSKSFDATTRHSLIHIGDNSASARFVQINKSVTDGVLFGNNNSENYPHSGAFNTNQTFITTGLISGDNSTSNNFIIGGWSNGTPFSTNNNFDGMSLNLSVSNAYVGIGAAVHGYKGDMNEILIFNRALQNDERQQVEGYLAWKWGVVQNLPVTHPYYYAKAPQTAFQPTNFPSCALWLDAADRNTVSGPVTQWNDKSGNGRHFVAAGSSPTPTFSNSAFLGRPGIQFTRTVNTSRTVLQWTNSATPLVTSDITVMMLVRRTANNTSQDRLLSATSTLNSEDSDKADSFGFVNRFGSNSIIHRNGRNTATTPPVENIGAGASQIITMTINRSTLTSTIRRSNSTATTTGTRTGESDSVLNLRQIRLGTITEKQEGSSDGGLFTFQGVFSEVLIYNSVLTTTQLDNLEGYLAWKYQLATTLLPSSHQYYTASPVGIVPTNISGCQLWLDASDFSSMNLSLTQWNDKSGNGSNATQSTAANQPTFSSSAVNFGNVDRFMSFSNLSMMRNIPCAGLFSVLNVKSSQTSLNRSSIFIARTTDSSSRFNATVARNGVSPTPPRPGVGGRRLDAEIVFSNLDAAEDAYTTNTPFSLFQEANYTTRTLNVFKDGTNIASGTATYFTEGGGTTSDTNSSEISISNSTASAAMNNVDVRELILFTGSPLTTAQRQQVEGYLAWKWNLQGNLPSTHPFTQANYFFNNTRPFSRYFNPPDIEGCQLWIDAADANTVTLNDSGKVTSILDKSGLANNISNTGSTVTYTSTLNSRPVLTFPSTGTVAGNTLSTPSLTRDPVNFSAFYVCRYPSSGANPIQVINFDLSTGISTTISAATKAATTTLTVGSSAGFVVGRYIIITGVTPTGYNQTGLITAIPNSTQLTVDLSRGDPGVNYTSGGTVTQLTASHMFGQDGRALPFNIQNVNYEAGTVTGSRALTLSTYTSATTLANNTFILGCVRQNGELALSTNGITHSSISTSGPITLGNKTTGAYSIFGGVEGLNIAEVIIYNAALTATERQSIEGYLSWKWGIQRATSSTNPSVTSALTYPSTHPYYNFPPVDVTPMTPALRLYKRDFDPSDLSPAVWFDSQDRSTFAVESDTNRVIQWKNKGSSTRFSYLSNPLYASKSLNATETVSNISNLSGPILSKSIFGAASGSTYLDFLNGGSFNITSAEVSSTGNIDITLGTAETVTVTGGSITTFSPLAVISGSHTTTVATIYFTEQLVPPFLVGTEITIADTTSSALTLTGTYEVTGCTPFYVTFLITAASSQSSLSTLGTITSSTYPRIAVINYTTQSASQELLAGHQISNISGLMPTELNGLTPTVIYASYGQIRFLTNVSNQTISAGGTIVGPIPRHGILQGKSVTVGITSGAIFSDGTSTDNHFFIDYANANGSAAMSNTFGKGTPYIVSEVPAVNKIRLSIPTSIPTGSISRLISGKVEYGIMMHNRSATLNAGNITSSGGSAGATVIITFTLRPQFRNAVFHPGDTVFIGDTTPTTYRRHWYVTGWSVNDSTRVATLTFETPITLASLDSAGTIYKSQITMPSSALGITGITVAGTTATVTYNNSLGIAQTGGANPFKVGHFVYISNTTASSGDANIFNGTFAVTRDSIDTVGIGTLQFTTSAAASVTAGAGLICRGTGGTGVSGVFPTTSCVISDSSVTVSFAKQPILPFIVGQQINLVGTVSSGTNINGIWTVASSVSGSVTFNIPSGATGSVSTQGNISGAVLRVTSGSYASGSMTLNFTPARMSAFANDTMVSVYGVAPNVANGYWRVTGGTTTSVIVSGPTGSGTVSNTTGTVGLALPLTIGTSVPHGLSTSSIVCPSSLYTVSAEVSTITNIAGLTPVRYQVMSVPNSSSFTILPRYAYYNNASGFPTTVGPVFVTSIDTFDIQTEMAGHALENTRTQDAVFDSSTMTTLVVNHLNTQYTMGGENVSTSPTIHTSNIVNSSSTNIGNFYYTRAPIRHFYFRNNQPFFNITGGRDMYYQSGLYEGGTSQTGAFRHIVLYENLTASAINDIDAQTTALSLLGYRIENSITSVTQQAASNVVSGSVRGVVTNATWSGGTATLTIVMTGAISMSNGNSVLVQGINPSGYNGSFTLTGTPTVTTIAYAVTPNPGTYVPGTGTVLLSTPGVAATSHVRIGAHVAAVGNPGGPGTSGVGQHAAFYQNGIADIIAFNRILTVEERQLLEGWISQRYRYNSIMGATSVVASPTYRITGASYTGSSAPYTITVTYASSLVFLRSTQITISGVTESGNTGLNGIWAVTASNATSVSFLSRTIILSGASVTITSNNTLVGTTIGNSSIHPYRLNPTTIAGQNTLSLTSTTSTYAQNLVAWFDAANPNLINNLTLPANGTPATNNTAVTLWAPTSGWWANTPLQLANSGTATYHSTTAGRTQNGLGGIYIGGSTNRLSLATGAFTQYTTINANNNFTWTVVFRPDSVSATTPVLSVTSGTSNRLMLCSDGTFIYSNGTTSQTLTSSAVLTDAKTHMITVYRYGATMGFRIVSENTTIGSAGYLAGTSTQTNLAIPTFTSGTPSGSPNPTLTFGAIGVSGFATSFTGSIFEAALFRSAMSTQAIQQVEGYLASKWGLQGSLPTSHAYKKLSA